MHQRSYQPDPQYSHIFWLQREHFDFRENAAWLERTAFSLRAVYDVVAAPDWKIVAPDQPWNEIWLVKSGRVKIQIGAQSAVVQSGEIAILSAGKNRETSELNGAPLAILGFTFDATVLGTFDIFPLLEPPIRLCPGTETRTKVETALHNAVEESRSSRGGFSLAAQSWAGIALVETLRAALSQEEIERRLQSRLRNALAPEVVGALDFIAEHFAAPLELHDLARHTHLSPQHFTRKFKNATGVAPMEYLRHFRLAKAHELLESSDRSIGDIGFACGFPDAAYFSRAFKGCFGVAPLDFRKQTRALSPKNG